MHTLFEHNTALCHVRHAKRWAAAVFLCSATIVQAEQSDQAALFQHRAQHAYNAVIGLPSVASRPVQSWEWQIALEHSNQFAGGMAGDEVLLLDGETSELTLRHRQRVGPCWQADVTVPFIAHSGGLFDRAIDDWHQFFGLPDAQRGETAKFDLNYSYVDQDGQRAGVASSENALGDIQLSIQRSLGCFATADSTRSEPIVRLGVKLPTGRVNVLSGSGEPDVYADIQSPIWTHGTRWRTGVALGALLIGQTDRLAPQRTVALYGSAGAQFVLTHRWRLIAQLDWHTPFYRSNLRELGDPALSLSTGFRYLGPADQSIELSISEDISVDTAPDIVARLAWTYRPAGRGQANANAWNQTK